MLRYVRRLLLFMIIVLANFYLMLCIESRMLKINCFSYETAFENFRDECVTEETVQKLLENSRIQPEDTGSDEKSETDRENKIQERQINMERFGECLAMYFALDQISMSFPQLEETISLAKEYQPEKFYAIADKITAMWTDAEHFPVGKIDNYPDATVAFTNSWKQSRTFGGDRFHEGCDLMPSIDQRGIYPIYSVSDGVVEKIGWLRLGGYRIGIRSEHGVYFYYAHLSDYAKEFSIGEPVKAGTLLGFMGDTGYSDIEGTTGNFPVHLHFGIYFNEEDGTEFSVNPYPLLRYLYAADNLYDE